MANADAPHISHESKPYQIDATHAPDYVVLSPTGPVTSGIMAEAASELDAIMDGIVGAGQPYCPVILDIRRANVERLTFSGSTQVMRMLRQRSTRAIMLLAHEQDTALMTFFKTMSSLVLRMETAYSLEEALEKLKS